MKARLFPINDSVFSGAFALMADALSHTTFAPSRAATFGERVDAPSKAPRVGFWEQLDRWAWRRVQKDREAYLSQAQNLADLEDRIRHMDCARGRYF